MASAGELSPILIRPVNQVGPVGKRAHKADREPVARRLAEPSLRFHIMRKVRQRVPLRCPAFVADIFIASSE